MKKGLIITILIFIVLMIFMICIKFIPFGTKEATMGANITTLEIPKFSTLKEECCTYEATFKTLRSGSSIEKEFKKMLDNYIEVDCNGKKVYFDSKHNITIFEYEIKGGLIFSTFTLKYNLGQTCE